MDRGVFPRKYTRVVFTTGLLQKGEIWSHGRILTLVINEIG